MTPLRHTLPALAMGMLLAGCSSGPDRAPDITLLDFRTQNVERLHAGIMRLIGDDSAGVAVGEYVKAYEEGLERYLPVRGSTVSTIEENPAWGWWYSPPLLDNGRTVPRPVDADPTLRRLRDYLRGQRLSALTRLREHSDAFAERGDVADAKMGVANAYIASTAMPSPSEITIIADLVEPMLAALKNPRSAGSK